MNPTTPGARILLVALASLPAACAGVRLGALDREVTGTPADVVFATVDVFHRMGAPVEFSDPLAGIVRSADFQLPDTWSGEPPETWVDCGLDRHGQPRSHGAVVWMSMEMRARQGAGGHRSRVRLDAAADGASVANSERFRCAVRPEFSRRVLDAIAAESGRYRE